MSLLNKLKAQTATTTAEVKPEVAAEVAKLKAEEKGCAPVLPPDAPKSSPALAAVPIPVEQASTLSPELQAAIKAQQAAVDAAPAGLLKKRGRPPKSITQSTPAESSTPPADASTYVDRIAFIGGDLESAAVTNHMFQTKAAEETQLNLYVDCNVEGPLVSSLEPYIAHMCEAMCEEFKVVDIRCAPQDSPLGYGKWKGLLTAFVRAHPPAKIGIFGIRYVKESEIKQTVVEALRPMCTVFVRGIN